ncbi:hypothetical protein [Cohaesibacter celericrescens]|uniref:hypothetical protein n=1 Tax=Cohaesibacter celericrescens TaxID=2067669 RepID=UPI00356688C3
MLQRKRLTNVASITINAKQNNWRSITFTMKDGTLFILDVTGNTGAIDALPKAGDFVDLDAETIAAE